MSSAQKNTAALDPGQSPSSKVRPSPKAPTPPTPSSPRSRVLPPCRVSEYERKQIGLRAAEAGLTVSAFLRKAALETVILRREPLADKQLLRALAALGNNLNQIAREVNIHGAMDIQLEERLSEALFRNAKVMDTLLEIENDGS